MKFRVWCKLQYSIQVPVTLIFHLRAHRSAFQSVLSESLTFNPSLSVETIICSPEPNCFDRVQMTEGSELSVHYEAEVEVHHQLLNPDDLRRVPPAQLGAAHLPYLFPSRYCQSDRLGRFAWQKFSGINGVYDQVLAITQWIYDNVEYIPGSTNSATSAYDTPTEGAGVCRDFAHLGIALCRALNVPARYFSGYAYQLNPPDFHACFEAFIGDRWVLFDATRLSSPNGLIRIGIGRDAADVAVCTAFGFANSVSQEVGCDLLEGEFHSMSPDELSRTAITLAG